MHAYCIDNALCKPGDPLFFGICIENNVHASAKVVPKVCGVESLHRSSSGDSSWLLCYLSDRPLCR